MADIHKVIKNIKAGRELEKNLPLYRTYLTLLAGRMASLRLAINQYYLTDFKEEYVVKNQEWSKLYQELESVIGDCILGEKDREEGLERLKALRSASVHMVEKLTCYSDWFSIYEYVLNRLEYRFKEGWEQEQVSNEFFTERFLKACTKDKDQTLFHLSVQEMVGQLPLRMTKAKFYERLRDAMSVYRGSDRSTLEDFLYMVRTKCLLWKPEDFEDGFGELAERYLVLKELNYGEITGEEYERGAKALEEGSAMLNDLLDAFMLLQEAINDCYIVLLCTPITFADSDERENCRRILEITVQIAAGEDEEKYTEELEDIFIALEGSQEELSEKYDRCAYLLDDIRENYPEEKQFEDLYKIELLMSTSHYVDLNRAEKKEEAVDDDFAEAEYQKLVTEFDACFQQSAKPVRKAVMAAALSSFPVFFQSVEEIRDYMNDSLNGCRDMAERKASMELLSQIMDAEE